MRSDHEQTNRATHAAPVVRPSLKDKAAQKRARQREKAAARVRRPVVPAASQLFARRNVGVPKALVVFGLSVLAHSAVAAFALVASLGSESDRQTKEKEIVTIREVVKHIEPAAIEKAPSAPETTVPVEPERPKPRPIQAKQPQPVAAQPASDPVDSPAPAQAQPRRRIVGLSYESTTEGPGPAYAVGNTRMGTTEKTAQDKDLSGPRSNGSASLAPANEVASFVPTSSKLEKPRRLTKIDLQYPSILMARGVEGDVVVRIHILEDGSVANVDIVRSSGHDEFDAAARQAALREKFAPARRSGEAVDFVLEYTYRFRLKTA